MCGIIGYVGRRDATDILVGGLESLGYRGYDSVGLAVQNGRGIGTRKVAGGVGALKSMIARSPVQGMAGIGHTRWATHGAPVQRNAHPHQGCGNELALVHNGIIDNVEVLREMLAMSGHTFHTETDTEVLAHLIEEMPGQILERRVAEALRLVEGTYGIAVMSEREPGKLVAARNGSPLLLGIGEGEFFITSDGSAVRDYTRTVVHLEDGDLVVVTRDGYVIRDATWQERARDATSIAWSVKTLQLGPYDHFMHKEIHEQPASIRATLRGRLGTYEGPIRLHGLNMGPEQLAAVRSVLILGCGTSYHAGLVGRRLIEGVAGVPVQVEDASTYDYRNYRDLADTLVVAISQSGETPDTLRAMELAKAASGRVVGIVNVVGSTIAREATGGIYLHAGPEIGVGSTKAFTSQVAALALLALKLGREKRVPEQRLVEVAEALDRIPEQIHDVLALAAQVRQIAEVCASARRAAFVGSKGSLPVALEGALKLKEITAIDATGLPVVELEGPATIIREKMPVFYVVPGASTYDRKALLSLRKAKAQGGRIIVISTAGSTEYSSVADYELQVPATLPDLSPLLSVIPLQLLGYYMAVMRGCPVDRPGNLASVTVA